MRSEISPNYRPVACQFRIIAHPTSTFDLPTFTIPSQNTSSRDVQKPRGERVTHLPDFLNGIGEDVDNNEPLLHAGLGLHLHQHGVSEQHKECQVHHLWGRHTFPGHKWVTVEDTKQTWTQLNRNHMDFNMMAGKYNWDHLLITDDLISRKAQESTVLYSMVLWKERRALFSNAWKWAGSHLVGSWSEFSEPCTFWHGHSQANNKPRGNRTPSPPFKQKTSLGMPKEQYF